MPLQVALAFILLVSVPAGGIIAVIVYAIGQLDPTKQNLNIHPDYRIVFVACYGVALLASIVSMIRVRSSKARLEINDGTLLEYDRYGRLLVRAELDSVKSIEKVRLIKHDAYFVHFANGQLAVIGNGLEGFAELRRLVLSKIPGEPVERRFDDLQNLMKVVNNRPVIPT